MTTWQDKIRSSTPKEEWFCLKHVMSRWLASQAFLSYTQPERPNSSSGKTGKKKKISYCLLTTYELRVCLLTKKLKIKPWKNENPISYVSELINPDSHYWRADLIDRIFMPKLVRLKVSLWVQIEGKIAFYFYNKECIQIVANGVS